MTHGSGTHRTVAVEGLSRVEGEQRVVAAQPDVNARVELRAALPNEDAAGLHDFAAVTLDAEHLRLGVSTVSR